MFKREHLKAQHKTSRSVKLIKSSATSTTVENRKKNRGNQLRTSTKFIQRLSYVFLTTSF